jgi:hypothetical protein
MDCAQNARFFFYRSSVHFSFLFGYYFVFDWARRQPIIRLPKIKVEWLYPAVIICSVIMPNDVIAAKNQKILSDFSFRDSHRSDSIWALLLHLLCFPCHLLGSTNFQNIKSLSVNSRTKIKWTKSTLTNSFDVYGIFRQCRKMGSNLVGSLWNKESTGNICCCVIIDVLVLKYWRKRQIDL